MNQIIKIILHLFYWMVFCLFSGLVGFKLANGFDFIAKNIPAFLFNLGWAMIQFYLFYFFFYRLIERQKYTLYFLVSVVVSIGLSFILTLLFSAVFSVRLHFKLMEILPQTTGTFIIAQTGSLLKGFIGWFEDIQRKQELEKSVLRNELDALNAQLNPHFLFNTLNNIDSLIHSNPEKASKSLVELSEIMRYMLYDSRKPMVCLHDEIEYYRNIIELQQLRLKSSNLVKFEVEVQDDTFEIAPLLFLPFIENAFKHAAFDDERTAVRIMIRETGTKVEFSSRNHFRPNDSTTKSKTGGIGLSNLKRRLDLLYPGRYILKIDSDNSEFVAQLTIEQ